MTKGILLITIDQGVRLAILLVLLITAAPYGKAENAAVESILNAGSIGGTHGYRLRRIGAVSAAESVNSNFVYYPASAMKIWEHFYAMSRVQANEWDLDNTDVSVCTGTTNCDDTPNEDDNGCVAVDQALDTTLNQMMVPSSNAATNAIQEAVGFLADANDPNPAASGRSIMNTWGSNEFGISNSGINSKFGCGGACGSNPNELTLVDNERIYRNIASGTLDAPNRVLLKNLMLNEASGFFTSIVNQEAASLNRDNIRAEFLSKTYYIYKSGSWTCANGDSFRTTGGLIQLPTYGGAYKRLFTYGVFIDETEGDLYLSGTVSNAARELLRSAIRGALLTWPNDYVGGTNIQSLQNDVDPLVEEFASTEAGSFVQAAHDALGRALTSIPTRFGTCQPDYKTGIREMEIAVSALLDANRGVQDTRFTDLIEKSVITSAGLGKDLYALVVSTSDASDLSEIVSSMDSDLADANERIERGSSSEAMPTLVSAADRGYPLINCNDKIYDDEDSSIGFSSISNDDEDDEDDDSCSTDFFPFLCRILNSILNFIRSLFFWL